MMKAFGPEVKSHPLTTTMCSMSAASVNLVARKHSDVASGEFQESGGLYGGDENGDKKKGNKDDGRNSNASFKQSELISVFVLLSLGSLNSKERVFCVSI